MRARMVGFLPALFGTLRAHKALYHVLVKEGDDGGCCERGKGLLLVRSDALPCFMVPLCMS